MLIAIDNSNTIFRVISNVTLGGRVKTAPNIVPIRLTHDIIASIKCAAVLLRLKCTREL